MKKIIVSWDREASEPTQEIVHRIRHQCQEWLDNPECAVAILAPGANVWQLDTDTGVAVRLSGSDAPGFSIREKIDDYEHEFSAPMEAELFALMANYRAERAKASQVNCKSTEPLQFGTVQKGGTNPPYNPHDGRPDPPQGSEQKRGREFL